MRKRNKDTGLGVAFAFVCNLVRVVFVHFYNLLPKLSCIGSWMSVSLLELAAMMPTGLYIVVNDKSKFKNMRPSRGCRSDGDNVMAASKLVAAGT